MTIPQHKFIRFSNCLAILLLWVVLLFSLTLSAAELTDQPESQSHPFDALDTPRNYLATKFVSFASDIDRFFGDDRNYQESNTSVIQLDLTRASGYGADRKFELTGRAKLSLPNTENRMHLLLETDPEKNLTSEKKQVQPVVRNKIVTPGSLALAARYEKAEESRWHYSTDAGVQFRGLTTSPNPFARARGSYSVPLGEWRGQWRLKAAQSLFWFNTIGAGETTQLDLEHLLGEPMLFRASSNATWLHDKQNLDMRQDLSIFHTMSDRTALLYQASVIGVSHPQVQLMDYVLLLLYRYRWHRDWIFIEISPQLHFPKENNFRYSPLLNLRLEMLFDESR